MRRFRSLNNKGAALVMVILAMMFVGIIAAIALTLTVGNSKSAKATIDTSENFYTSENILNDLEIYLKKLATNAATQAYASALTDLVPGKDVDEKFQEKFADKMDAILKGDGSTAGKLTGNVGADNSFNLALLQEICYDRYGLTTKGGTDGEYTLDPDKIPVKIKYGSIVRESGKIVIKDVTITLKENGYESTITTDITFDAVMPRTGTMGTEGEFDYPIDHYLLIAGNDIKPTGYSASPFTRGSMYGTYIGNIYAYNDFIVNGPISEAVNIKAASMIVGKDVIVDKQYGSTDGQGIFRLGHVNNDAVIYENGAPVGTSLWADNFKVYDGKVTLTDTKTNLGGSLELNGESAEFTAAGGGELLAYSYGSGTVGVTSVGKTPPKSSAIILNGLGAKLDLSGLSSLKVTGTAYTAISDLANIDSYYSSYNAPESVTNLNYYTQGESITYRTLQALYLVPGNLITNVGHNPMSASEAASGLTVTIPGDISDYLNSSEQYKVHYERYVGDSASAKDKVYVLWNFKDKASAVTYFDKLLKMSTGKKYFDASELGDKQMGMLDTNHGYITLPSSGVSLFGNAVYLDGGELKYIKGNGTSAGKQDTKFDGLKSYIQSSKSGNGNSLVQNMFSNNELSKFASGEQQAVELVGPLHSNTDKEGKALTYSLQDGPENSSHVLVADYKTASLNDDSITTKYTSLDDATYKYVLVTGDSINWTSGFDSNTSYIFITPGDVKITTEGYFRGMIIAGGSISLPSNLKMECLGMLSYIQYVNGVAQPRTDTTEFKALLGVQKLTKDEANEYVEDASSANFKLRQIFGVADTSATGGSGSGDDFVTILTSEWKRN